ncbi:MAG: hypothetical protein FWH46_02970 [Methanimicrococcus sp.]|nr:hypothetical protein [Methanimicrococcus sp.]
MNHKIIKISILLLTLLLVNITAGQDNNLNDFIIASNIEIVGGDSITPMKIEMDFTKSETVTKTVTLKNTGNMPTTYIFYTDAAGVQTQASSCFDLSETKIELAAGESYDLKISASVEELQKYSQTELDDLKLKIVRDSETTTPIGYILPINITGQDENKIPENNTSSGNKTNNETANNTGMTVQNNNTSNNTDSDNSNADSSNSNNNSNYTNGSSNNNSSNNTNFNENDMNQKEANMKKIAALGLTLCVGLLIAISCIYYYQLKKRK